MHGTSPLIQKGFTLIELLVVIAIIGILSAVVLASLSTAKNKGTDASVEESMHNLRTATEIYYNSQTPGSYGATATDCASGIFAASTGNVAGLIAAINTATKAGGADYSNMDCDSASDAWAIAARLPSGAGYFCVDSVGWSNTKAKSGQKLAYTALTGAIDVGAKGTNATVCR